ncbi:MAG: PCMD domain-containing protein [Dysgonamonadaceae bacterium]|jgi:hypothetical protein|nr:PCMD domain-containing protein [Dysgonamonadaceae bacterium]
MKHLYWFLVPAAIWMVACIKDAPLNPEADILSFAYPAPLVRADADVENTRIVVYPNGNVDLLVEMYSLSLTPGATCEEIRKPEASDTLFFIKVCSENRENTKLYAIIQVPDTFPEVFTFEDWVPSGNEYLYENPMERTYLWSSSNIGAALAFHDKQMSAEEYPVSKTLPGTFGNTTTAAQLITIEGPGDIFGRDIPCLSASVYLGKFDPLKAMINPLLSTQFGVPFHWGKPKRLQGRFHYTEGGKVLGNNPEIRDSCDIYAVLFKPGESKETLFLNGENIGNSPRRVARAGMRSGSTHDTEMIPFDIPFLYHDDDPVYLPFDGDDLKNNKYKITIVCASGYMGDYYQGRKGSCLIVDDIRIVYEQQ